MIALPLTNIRMIILIFRLLSSGDSGFTKPDLYEQCETSGMSYVVYLKESSSLRKMTAEIDGCFTEAAKDNLTSYVVRYGEFMHQVGFWNYPHQIVCKVKKLQVSLFICIHLL